MLVQCPKCKTTYKVSDDVVRGATPAFRCSRCKHTFEFQVAAHDAADAATEIRRTDQSTELAFSFEPIRPAERETVGGEVSPRADSPPASPANTAKPLGAERAVSALPQNSKIDKTPDAVIERSATVEEPHPAAQPPRESFDKVLSIEPYREQRASVMPFLTLFGLLVLLSAFGLAYQRNYPAASEGWVASIPLLGPSVVRNNHLKNGVLLKSVETKFQVLQGNREAVVLTGVAVNQNPIMIRNVQLSGQLFDQEGREIERQTMWIGNAISAQIIRGMTAQDIIDLQRLKPLKTFEIPPGDSVPFAIVFLRPGKSLKDARCEVLSVEAV
jgi:predicted Zn finger-like uncharacterized protein